MTKPTQPTRPVEPLKGPLPEGLRSTFLPNWQLAVFLDAAIVPKFLRHKDIYIQPNSRRRIAGANPMSGEAGVESWVYCSNLHMPDDTLAYVDENCITLMDHYADRVAAISWWLWGPHSYLREVR